MAAIKIDKLLTSITLCLGAGFIGSFFTASAIDNWYSTLQKPSFNPPNYIFAPVWTTIYILMGISLYIIWISKNKKKEMAFKFFLAQLFLNVLWSLVFFGVHNIAFSLICIIFLWFSILFTIIYFYKISKNAAYLLFPYIIWVSFASFLNYSIFILN